MTKAKDWFEKLLTGSADLSGWKKIENGYDDEDESSEEEDTEWEESSACPGEAEDTGDENRPEDTNETAEAVTGFDKPDALIDTEEATAGKSETDTRQTEENIKSFWQQLQREQKGQMRNWRQLLVILERAGMMNTHFSPPGMWNWLLTASMRENTQRQSWNGERRRFNFFPGVQNDLMVIWCTNNTGKGDSQVSGERRNCDTGKILAGQLFKPRFL